jgi:hypothetical protein
MDVDMSLFLVFGYLVSLLVTALTIYFLLTSLKQKTKFAGYVQRLDNPLPGPINAAFDSTKLQFAQKILGQITQGLKTKFTDAVTTAISFANNISDSLQLVLQAAVNSFDQILMTTAQTIVDLRT